MSKLGDGIRTAAETAKEGVATAKAKTARTSAAVRGSAARGVNSSKQLAARAAKKSSDGIDKNPLAILLGGLAIGAIVGSLIPATEREKKMMGKAGKKLNNKAKNIAGAATDAGKKKVKSLGLSEDAVREQFRTLVNKAADAVKAAGQAASKEARKKN